MRSFIRLLLGESGFVAAEKVLITLLALGIALVVGRFILAGASTSANNVKTSLESSSAPKKK